MMVLCATAAQAGSDGPSNPSFLLFAGSAAGGWAADSFARGGPYLRLGVTARY
jgi:hypothetical protein